MGFLEGCASRPIDQDRDGFPQTIDCADENTPGSDQIHPEATEVCDAIDNNCDGQIDEGVNYSYYLDQDGDTYGDPKTQFFSCASSTPTGAVTNADDFDDTDPDVNIDKTWYADDDGDGYGDPENTEISPVQPDGYVDNDLDCDDTDTEVNPDTAWYEDFDGDGYGNANSIVYSCEQPDGYVDNIDDCDDTDFDANTEKEWFLDRDGDGYGDANESTWDCERPDGYVVYSGDEDHDDDATVYPGAPEYCDGKDNDLDGTVDEDALDASTWYADNDADGFGDDSDTIVSCTQPEGYIATPGDNGTDDDNTVYPGATEYCDGKDNDLDGDVDEDAVDASTWYADDDGDGFGDPDSITNACSRPTGYVADKTDCDDTELAANPGEDEVCTDGIDNNCDGDVDEDTAVDANTWYQDADGDGFGNASDSVISCAAPTGYIADDTDLDDTDAAIYPGAPEICDEKDNDGDGLVDDADPGLDTSTATTWYADDDGDGYGDAASSTPACDQPSGYVSDDTDCDDTDANIHPNALDESLNGAGINCSGDEEFYSDTVGISIVGDSGDSLGRTNTLSETNIDGAGTNDLVIGIPDSDYNGTSSGAVAVLQGENSRTLSTNHSVYDVDLLWYGATGSQLGSPVSYGINGSGCGSFLVGAQGLSSVYLVLCESSISTGTVGHSIAADADATFTGIQASSLSAGDHDGDGYGDVLIGDSTASTVFIYPGSSSGVTTSADQTLTGTGSAGHDMYALRDIDGDGDTDLLVSAYEYSGSATNNGRVYLLLGPLSSGTLDSEATFIWEGNSANDKLGESVVAVADTNGDGLSDILIGSANATDTGSHEGAVYYFDGATATAGGTGVASDADVTFWGTGDQTGVAMDARDFTGDGLAEICIGSPENSDYASNAGQVQCLDPTTISGATIYLDSASGITRIYGSSTSQDLGRELVLFDFTGNGTADVMTGSTGASSGGAVFIITE